MKIFTIFSALILCAACSKSDVERCVDAQVEQFKECSSKKEKWCEGETETSTRANASLACLQMSGKAK